MPTFTLEPLTEDRIGEAYPLVRMVHPAMTFAEWEKQALAHLQDGGVLTLVAPSGIIQALAGWKDQQESAALRVDLFVVFELSRKAPARRALCEGLQALALERRKQAVQFPLGSLGLLESIHLDGKQGRQARAV